MSTSPSQMCPISFAIVGGYLSHDLFSFSCSPRMLLRCSYSCFLSTASIHSIIWYRSEGTLRALSRWTTVILRLYFLILRASSQMAISYVSIEVSTEAKSFLRGWRGPPIFGMSLANALATLAALAAAYCSWALKFSLVSNITPKYLIFGWGVMVHCPTSRVKVSTFFRLVNSTASVLWSASSSATDFIFHCTTS